jgi:hypothetical protein
MGAFPPPELPQTGLSHSFAESIDLAQRGSSCYPTFTATVNVANEEI